MTIPPTSETEQLESGAKLDPKTGLWIFPRQEFASQRFRYKAGEHVLFAGPTQNGKTSLAFDLLAQVATVEVPAIVIVSKPNDPVSSKSGKKLGYRRLKDWPPKPTFKEMTGEKPKGYLVWPEFGDMNTDVENASIVSANTVDHVYAAGVKNKKAILVLDDTYVKAKVLGLDGKMTTLLAMAGAMGIGVWVFVQKPTGAGQTALMAYGASEHIFLFNEPDKRNRERFGEIGGVDPKVVEKAVLSLKPYQALYIRRTGRHMCIVDKD